jgi:dipeptidyl aminopeptidase/acylaminoacyl peptidase
MRKQGPRANQNWIFDSLINLTDNEDILHPGIMGGRMERGFKFGDLERIYSRVKSRRSFPKEWARAARKQEELAVTADKEGRLVTAGGHYHRAALYWGRVQHLIPVVGNQTKIDAHASTVRCYDRMIEILGGSVTKFTVDIGDGEKAYCLFHAAPDDGPKPTVLYLPGMDAIKEDSPNPYNNDYTRRGMNICVMDGPGQGECNINHVWQTIGKYSRAGKCVVDTLVARDDVDADKIGIFGTSMGSRYSVEIAAYDERLKCCVGQMANVCPTDIIFNQAQPNFKRIYMYMTNISDEAEFDKYADEMDEFFFTAGEKLKAPYLLVAGELDELCPPEDVAKWLDRLNCPKELWMYEDVFHPMGEVAADIYPNIADWILETLNNGRPAGHDKRLMLEP